jgi:hypothetical protein
LRAPRRPNSKALALSLSGYATPSGRTLPGAVEHLEWIPQELERMNLLTDGAGWGYHFDVQTRNIRYSSSTPNAIATCFVVGALLDEYHVTRREASRALALAARPFLLSLQRESRKHGPFFGYVQRDPPLVHNANLLVCGTLARLDALEANGTARSAIEAAVGTTLALTRSDGLWRYGELPNYDWVDNFHTAYTLEGLVHVSSVHGIGGEALARGASAWQEQFIERDGWARYYPERRFPLETHCCASAIDLLCTLDASEISFDPSEVSLAVADTAIRELWIDAQDRFAFRRTGKGLNLREYMRWTNAPMFRALARFKSTFASSHGENTLENAEQPL